MDNTPRHRYEQRWTALKSERSSWVTHWQDLSRNLQPRSGRFFVTDRNRGSKRHNAIYDNTGTRALRTLSAGLMAGMTSPARPWFRLTTADSDLNAHHETQVWLANVRKIMLAVFARSNTYRALQHCYLELGLFGTAGSIILPNFQKVIHHYPQTVGEYAIACNPEGRVDTFYREFQKPVNEVVAEYGYANCTPGTQRLWDGGNLDAWVTLRHAIEPREDRDRTSRDARNMPWASITWEAGSPPDKYLRESGFKHFRALAPRWEAIGGDIYGASPAMDALGDVKQLQHQQLRKAQAIDQMALPTLQAPPSMKNDGLNRVPGGVVYSDGAGAAGGVRNLYDVRLDLNHLLADINDVRGRVNAAVYADLFLMLASMPADGSMTATEVAERHEEKLLMLGPVLERLHDELLDPLISLTFYDMLDAGLVPPPPPEMQGQPVRVEFVSTLAQAQRAVGTNSLDRFVSNLGVVARFKPEVLDKFDGDKWVDSYADSLGVDPDLIVGDKQVALVRDARAKQQQQAEQLAAANHMADTAQKLAQVPTGGGQPNAASDLMNQFSGYGSPSPEQY
jgi:hypothetical protein